MASYYTVVQYVPDPVAGERINIGVIAFNERTMVTRFVSNWARVSRFGGEGDIAYLRDFARDLERQAGRTLRIEAVSGARDVVPEELRRMAREWGGSIQFTDPNGSTEAPEHLLRTIAERVLRHAAHTPRAWRPRTAAAAIAADSLEHAIGERLGREEQDLVKRGLSLAGRHQEHDVDVAVKNGSVLQGAWALSFDLVSADTIDHDVTRTLWALSDVRARHARLPLAVVVLESKGALGRAKFKSAEPALRGLKAEVVLEKEVASWAGNVAKRVAKHVH